MGEKTKEVLRFNFKVKVIEVGSTRVDTGNPALCQCIFVRPLI